MRIYIGSNVNVGQINIGSRFVLHDCSGPLLITTHEYANSDYVKPSWHSRLTRPFRAFAEHWRSLDPDTKLGEGLAYMLIGCGVLLAVLTPFALAGR